MVLIIKKSFWRELYAQKGEKEELTSHKKGYRTEILNPRDKAIDLFNDDEEYLTSITPSKLKMSFKQITEQNEAGIGRPKMKSYRIKRNRVKFTISPEDEPHWYFLPFVAAGEMKRFLQDADVRGNITDIISKIIRGETVTVIIPENREPYLKKIFKQGVEANPYKQKSSKEDVQALRQNLGYETN
jgi:hypothetical protein